MAISRKKKEQLVSAYSDLVGGAVNTIVLSQVGLTVNEVNNLRKQLKKIGGQLMIVKKRLLLKSLDVGHVESIQHDQIPGSLMLLVSKDETAPFAPLKAINDYVKIVKKEGLPYQVKYVGGRIEKTWKEEAFVSELANLPTKEELVSKLLYLLKHPISSFARVINEVANK